MSNPFIVIEALDAGGSQTQTDRLAARLTRDGYTVTQLHFPQEDRATGQMIYHKFLLAKNRPSAPRSLGGGGFSRREQALLYIQDFFSRAEDLWNLVNKKNNKNIILLDRYYSSTMAYQTIGLTGATRRVMLEWIEWLCSKGTPALPTPSVTILIDTPVEISLRRLAAKKKDFFETKQKLTAIRRSYVSLAQDKKWPIIPGVDKKGRERTREEIQEEIWQLVTKVLAKK